MEELKNLILEFYKKNNSVISVEYRAEMEGWNGPVIIVSGLDWNNRTLSFTWDTDIITVLKTLIENRYAFKSPTDIYGM